VTTTLSAFVSHAVEVGADPSAAEQVLALLVASLPFQPDEVSTVSYAGKASRARRYSLENVRTILADPDSGSISLVGVKKKKAYFNLSVYLRHNQGIELEYQPPGVTKMIMELAPLEIEDAFAKQIAKRFLAGISRSFAVLHGGACLHGRWDLGLSEATTVHAADQPPGFRDRISYDARSYYLLWERARRAYPITVLGKGLLAAIGGADTVQATGVTSVGTSGDALIVEVIDHLTEPHDSSFLEASRRFRELLWPHTIQNPADLL
jgi:hypothetical protein